MADATKNVSNTSITDDLYYSNYKKPTKQTGNSELGKDAFLQLLITQLQHQDPTNPMDDREFISQMAQFSSLEQMQNMTKTMESLLASQQQTQMMNYASFVGKEVKWHEITDKTDEKGDPVVNEGTGVIESLKFVDGSVVFKLTDGKEITPGNISGILGGSGTNTDGGNTVPESPLVQASKLIGKNVTYKDGDQELQGRIVSVSNKDGVIYYVLDNDKKLTDKDFTVISE
ncbi:MAG TPA: flagellar hook assembly protein FlgD [Lysinibacillus sp.]|jgi:flagellar basal-body rod modification protein FlgD|uniref:Basal-body rod modification protein FlgD n=1 Tax=Lysinibacillus fusiformis TaxID=28031 RepID=A0A2I0V4N7_9BACI|nr:MULTISPECIES: flagellar hook assembly protein FlgD [Lysinibacillus]HBT71815.1 flagellar hook assembly protein FlgD [Lysinibacillus sp.]KUF36468.1 flagellar biosynthesis protein FlgD [Lysinibacillus sp. F5]MEE3807019.1 flagellar hook assembly protein FlgD [Lysinibacillus fusiformis]PKU53269.1 flagellar hook assembly protein FlgD [Lysinibacillus fusiformis]WCH48772.1 flagellar hook assembly protein FlgD [Lysinibacillus sp. OF-1]